MLTGYEITLRRGKRDSLKSGHGCGIGNTLGARDFPCTVSGLIHSSLYGDPRERVLLNHTRRNTGFTSFAAHDFGLELTPKHPAA